MSEKKPTGMIPQSVAGQTTRMESKPLVSRDLADFGVPGVWVEVDPDTAEEMGAFEETAVSAGDAEDDDNGN